MSRGKMKSKLTPYMLILPVLLFLIILVIYPLLSDIYYSFFQSFIGQPTKFVGFWNYYWLMHDHTFLVSLENTVIFAFINVGACVGLGYVLASFINQVKRGKAIYILLTLLPLAISPMAASWMWKYLLHPTAGVVTALMKSMGLKISAPLGSSSTAFWFILLSDIWQWYPFMTILTLAGLESVPQALHRAASIDALTRWTKFKYVTFPQLKPVLLIGVMIRFMDAFRETTKPFIMARGGPGISSSTVGYVAWRTFLDFLDVGRGSTISLFILFAIILVCWLLFKKAYPYR
jgi:multiple sugar transport system permease protein